MVERKGKGNGITNRQSISNGETWVKKKNYLKVENDDNTEYKLEDVDKFTCLRTCLGP